MDERQGSGPVRDPRTLGARCDSCPLKGQAPVFAEPASSGRTRLIIVGEGPGRKEEIQGRPFIGVSGALLDQVLKESGIRREDAYVTNSTLCRPETDKDADRAAACCAPRLLGEIAATDAPVLALGKSAAKAVLGVSSIQLARGFVWTAPKVDGALKAAEASLRRAAKKGDEKAAVKFALRVEELKLKAAFAGRVVFPTVHPAFVLRSDAWRPILQIDVNRCAKWLRAELVGSTLEDNLSRTAVGVWPDAKDRVWDAGSDETTIRAAFAVMGSTVSCDIETTITGSVLTADVVCVGISDGRRTFVVDPWVPAIHAPLLSEFFAGRIVVGHNFLNFDMLALERDGVVFDQTPHDTLLAHHAYASHFPQKLDQVVSELCDSSPWKIVFGRRGGNVASEKGGLPPHKMPPDERDFYCACDCVLTKLAWDRMQKDLEPERHVYEHDRRLAGLCQRMQVGGIGVDIAERDALGKRLKRRRAALKGKMRTLLGRPDFSPRKVADVARALYKKLRAPILQRTKGGAPATSEAVLEAFAGQKNRVGKFARLMMTYRLVDKVSGTYIDPIPVGDDFRAHYNWKAFGTVSGRMAGRLQSCPRPGPLPEQSVRSLYVSTGRLKTAQLVAQIHDAAIFEVGDELVYFDLAQAEARLAAYLSGDPELIKAVETDIHAANALLLFGGMPPHPSFPSLGTGERVGRAAEKSPFLDQFGRPMKWKSVGRERGGCREERDVTKNAGFCVWYVGAADKVFTTLTSKGFPVTLRVCQVFYNRAHDKYWRYYRYVDRNLELVRRQGYMRTAQLGRFRWLGFFPAITDVANFPIQAGIADVMNERLMEIEGRARGMTCGDDVQALIEETWRRPVVLRKGPIVDGDREFVLPAEVKRGKRWSEL